MTVSLPVWLILPFLWSLPCMAQVADLHQSKNISCAACHGKEAPSAANVSEDACIECHGDSPNGKPVSLEGKEMANIHKGHYDTNECLQCHQGHKASKISCAECHKGATAIKVP